MTALLEDRLRLIDATFDGGRPGEGSNGHEPAKGKAQRLPRSFTRTDTGNSERLAARHGRNIRHNHSRKKWLVWSGTHWIVDGDGAIERLAKDTVRAIPGEAKGRPEPIYSEILKHAIASESAVRRRAMVDLARSEPGIPILPEQLDTDPWLLNMANGTFDLRTGRLGRHDRRDLITRCLSTPYRPSAQCPTWLQFLDRIFAGNADLIAYVQRIAGYSLTGSIREQAIFILFGAGENGKSTFLVTLSTLLEAYAVSANTDTFLEVKSDRIREDVAALEGARLVSASESAEGRRLSEVLVKQLTGGEKMRARRLHENGYEFQPVCKLWFSLNHRPRIVGTDHAIWRRIRLIPFNVTIPKEERDRSLPEKLRAEFPGILAWAVQGCREWLEHGEHPPANVLEATQEYRRDMDVLGDWLETCCVARPDVSTPARQLYESYSAYCERSGDKPVTQRSFGGKLTERGFGEKRTETTRYRTGIGILSSEPSAQASLADT